MFGTIVVMNMEESGGALISSEAKAGLCLSAGN